MAFSFWDKKKMKQLNGGIGDGEHNEQGKKSKGLWIQAFEKMTVLCRLCHQVGKASCEGGHKNAKARDKICEYSGYIDGQSHAFSPFEEN